MNACCQAGGNLTSDGAVSFTYDVENRLVEASGARNAEIIVACAELVSVIRWVGAALE